MTPRDVTRAPRPDRRAAPAPRSRAQLSAADAAVPWSWSAAIGLACGALYLWLAPAVMGPRDSAELTLSIASLGPAHPTGYPLYVLFGHLFGRVLCAAGLSWAFAANAWSAVGGAIAMALLHALGARLAPAGAGPGRAVRCGLALAAVAIIGMNPLWLMDAIFAEVYTWHLAWVAGTALLGLAALRRIAAAPPAWRPGARVALAIGAWAGLGVGHHATAVLPLAAWGVALAAALRARAWAPVPLASAGAGFALGSAGLAFTAWRAFHPAAYQWWLLDPSWRGVFDHVTGRAYGDLVGQGAVQGIDAQLVATYLMPVLVPMLVLLAVALWRARGGAERLGLGALLGAALAQVAFGRAYGVSDPGPYFEPALALAALSVPALGVALPRRVAPPVAWGIAGAVVLAGATWWVPLGRGLRTGTEIVEGQVRALWRSAPPGGGLVLWRHVMAERLRGYQLLDGERPELYAMNPDALTWPGPRRDFQRRFGFDPLAGLEPLTAAKVAGIAANVARQSPRPVYELDLDGRTLRLLNPPSPAR